MVITASKLRENLYKILDQVLETGAPVVIERRGRKLRIVPADAPRSKLERLEQHPSAIVGGPSRATDGPATVARSMARSPDETTAAIRHLVDEYRDRCLWFLRSDYYPEGRAAILRVLGYIERHADRRGYQRAAEIRQWLSHDSSATSADS